MFSRARKEEMIGNNNGRWAWMQPSNNGKHIRRTWNNHGHQLILKTAKGSGQIWVVWADVDLTSEKTGCHLITHATGEYVVTYWDTHSRPKELEHHCFPSLSSPFWVTFLSTSDAINSFWVTFQSKYKLLSNECEIQKKKNKMTNTC